MRVSLAALTVVVSHSATAHGFVPRRGLALAAPRADCQRRAAAPALYPSRRRRVLPVALEPFSSGAAALAPPMWAAYAAFVVFMTYVEGYKAFHRKFSPMVVGPQLLNMTTTMAADTYGMIEELISPPPPPPPPAKFLGLF